MSKTAVLGMSTSGNNGREDGSPSGKRAMDVKINLQKRKTASLGGKPRLTGKRRCEEELPLYTSQNSSWTAPGFSPLKGSRLG